MNIAENVCAKMMVIFKIKTFRSIGNRINNMSWSITLVGKSENIAKALEEYAIKLTGQSKEEYESALPHLVGLVKENFSKTSPPMLKIEAAGSGYADKGEQVNRNCVVSIQAWYGTIV